MRKKHKEWSPSMVWEFTVIIKSNPLQNLFHAVKNAVCTQHIKISQKSADFLTPHPY